MLWTLLSLAAIGAALWLLGVRDWRCYCLTALYPTTRSAVILGTVGPLLLLAVGVAWRWRDRLLAAGAAAGAAVALKLFLWPLAVWFGVLGRTRTALAAVGFALASSSCRGRRSASRESVTTRTSCGAWPTTRRPLRTRWRRSASGRTCRRPRRPFSRS